VIKRILVFDPLMEKILKTPTKKNRKKKERVILMKNSVYIVQKFCVIETDVVSRTGMGMLVI